MVRLFAELTDVNLLIKRSNTVKDWDFTRTKKPPNCTFLSEALWESRATQAPN